MLTMLGLGMLFVAAVVATLFTSVEASSGESWPNGSIVLWVAIPIVILVVIIIVVGCLWYHGYFKKSKKGTSVKRASSRNRKSFSASQTRSSVSGGMSHKQGSSLATSTTSSNATTSALASTITLAITKAKTPTVKAIDPYESVPEDLMAPKTNVLYRQEKDGGIVGLRPIPLAGPFGIRKYSRNHDGGQVGPDDDDIEAGAQPKSAFLNRDLASNKFLGGKKE